MNIPGILGDNKASKQYIHGVAEAIVTNNADPENLGRVKVKFPWFSGDNENETDWCRIAGFMAGPGSGGYFIPDVGDEVLVAFTMGDINRPYVIGALWNGKAKPPVQNSDKKNNIRMIKSRAGHEIVFNDDTEGKKAKIEINTAGGQKIILDDEAGKQGIKIQDKSGANKIVIDTQKKRIDIESSARLSIKGKFVDIEGTSALTLKSNGPVTVKGLPIKLN